MSNDLFERIKTQGVTLIEQMIESEQQESLTLDFKANYYAPREPLFENNGKRLTKTGRKTIAKAASAFANSMGGILIIGVDCRKIDGVDCAKEITPILEISRAFSTINNELHSITTPAISGIEAIEIPIDDNLSGLIAINIPRSVRRPHRAMATGVKSYFKRSGSSTIEMEHFEIEEAFLSNVGPDIELSLELFSGGSGGPGALPNERRYIFNANVMGQNMGGGIAKHVFLQCHDSGGILKRFGGSYDASHNMVGVVDGTIQAALPTNFVVHPTTKRVIESFPLEVFYNNKEKRIRI